MDLGRVTHRVAWLGTLGGLAAVYTGSLACAGGGVGLASQAAGALLAGAMGMIGSLFASDFQRHLAKRITDPSAALQNHDLNQLVAETIELLLREFGQQHDFVRKEFEALAVTAREQWPRVCRWPGIARLGRERLQGALEGDLLDLLADAPRDPREIRTLDLVTWRALLRFFVKRTEAAQELNDSYLLRDAAEHLASRFAWAFREKAKADFENGGRAYAGLHLMAMGELLATARESAASVAQIAAGLPRLEAGVAAAVAALIESMDEEARRRHRVLIARLIQLKGSVEALDESVGAMTAQLAEIARVQATTPQLVSSAVVAAIHALPAISLPPARTLLRLELRARLEIEPKNLAAQLQARNQRIPLIGRERELREFVEWLGADSSVALRVVSGDAGMGKTRLAIELCDRAVAAGWFAGFAATEALRAFEHSGAIHWAWDEPTLVVIDYVSGKAAELEHFLSALVERAGELDALPRLRVLVLDRHSGEGVSWWERALAASSGNYGTLVQAWYRPEGDLHLTRLEAQEDRRTLLRAAAEAFGAGQELDEAALSRTLERLDAQRLTSTPLVMQLSAIYSMGGGAERDVTREELLDEFRRRDEREIVRHLGLPGGDDQIPLFRRLVALATLLQGHPMDVSLLARAIEAEARELGCPAIAPATARRLLRDYLGVLSGAVQPLAPDLIAEHWILRELEAQAKEAPNAPPHFLELAVELRPEAAGEFLLRACQDFDGLSSLLSDAAVDAAVDRLPWETVAWRQVAHDLERRCVERARALLSESGEEVRRSALAESLYRFSFRLYGLDLREAALEAIEEAVAISRELARARPDAFAPHLALSLNNLSTRLADLGRREEALVAIEDTVARYRELARARPEVFAPGLALSLSNLSNRLGGLGRREEALSAIEEAVAIRRELARARPDAFAPDLASSLNNLSGHLANLGRREEALAAIEEAVGGYRELARGRPDAFAPHLAASLNNLSNRLGDLGRREEALAEIEEAVAIRRELARGRPDAFAPHLAASLNNLSNGLADLGRREEALAAIEEAVAIRRELARARPEAFAPDLALSLNNLSNRLADLGRREEALATIEEAVAIHREFARARPDAFAPDLAWSLDVRGDHLEALGRREEALEAVHEALTLVLPYLERHPRAHAQRAGINLRDYERRCAELSRAPNAELVQRVRRAFESADA